ncbi:alpha/beta fold hydrolase [Micromonospora sp. R77]|nr:alpha/beta fold hydrolase [Micromonospora sp. R77]
MSRKRQLGWLRSLTTAAAPSLRVVCFPHSGGSAAAFAEWASAMPPGVELLAVQYPGRSDRFIEPLVDTVSMMAAHAATELLRLPMGDYVLFGHSLGAVVAYETALALRDGGREPRRLCVSACLPPGHMTNPQVHLAPDDEFWEILQHLGGIEPGIAENDELRELLLPTLRSDLRAHATYQPPSAANPLSCPVTCYHGTGDPLVDEARLAGWAAVTEGEFALRVRAGGHFHIATETRELISDVLGRNPA